MKTKLRTDLTVTRTPASVKLSRAIRDAGLTQEAAGKLVGVEDRQVRRWLKAKTLRADRLDLLVAIERLSPRHGETNGLRARYVAMQDDTARKEPLDARGGSWAVATATATQGPTSGDSRERPAPSQQAEGAVAFGARNEKAAGLLEQPITPHAADDGGKTPRSGATGIQHSENDATETLPKLRSDLGGLTPGKGVRVKAEVVTAGETAPSGRRAA